MLRMQRLQNLTYFVTNKRSAAIYLFLIFSGLMLIQVVPVNPAQYYAQPPGPWQPKRPRPELAWHLRATLALRSLMSPRPCQPWAGLIRQQRHLRLHQPPKTTPMGSTRRPQMLIPCQVWPLQQPPRPQLRPPEAQACHLPSSTNPTFWTMLNVGPMLWLF